VLPQADVLQSQVAHDMAGRVWHTTHTGACGRHAAAPRTLGMSLQLQQPLQAHHPWLTHVVVCCAGGMLPGQSLMATELFDAASGRGVRLFSNAPGLQVYSGNFLEGAPGKGGTKYKKHQSVCLESQTYPNAVNTPDFPSPWVRLGETYQHSMTYQFFVRPA
jgi:galactose mutarotase-like enzyme